MALYYDIPVYQNVYRLILNSFRKEGNPAESFRYGRTSQDQTNALIQTVVRSTVASVAVGDADREEPYWKRAHVQGETQCSPAWHASDSTYLDAEKSTGEK